MWYECAREEACCKVTGVMLGKNRMVHSFDVNNVMYGVTFHL